MGWHEEVPKSTREETAEMLCGMQTTKWGNVAVGGEATLDLTETCCEVTSKGDLSDTEQPGKQGRASRRGRDAPGAGTNREVHAA